jgi:hypothetical protein
MGKNDHASDPAATPDPDRQQPADEMARALEGLLSGAGPGTAAGAGAGMAFETLSALLLLQTFQAFERAGRRQESLGRIGEATTAEGVTQIYTLGGIAAAVGAATLTQSVYPQFDLSLRAATRAFG